MIYIYILYNFCFFRFVLEKFFSDVVDEYRIENSVINIAISQNILDSNILKNFTSKNPAMGTVNKILRSSTVWSAVLKRFHLPPDCTLPLLDSSTLLYGTLSELIHHPEVKSVIVSDLSSGDYQVFFAGLAKLYKLKLSQFDEIHAEGYDATDADIV